MYFEKDAIHYFGGNGVDEGGILPISLTGGVQTEWLKTHMPEVYDQAKGLLDGSLFLVQSDFQGEVGDKFI